MVKRVGMILALAVAVAIARTGMAAEAKPNFIILFADDLGYGDLGCYGHPTIRTPNLDRMALEGMRFTEFYCGAPVCTPSRAALLTGRLPIRNGMANNGRHVLFPNSAGGLPDDEITIAEILRKGGYATACVGKWHLGHLPRFLPTRQGFDHYFGLPYSNDMGKGRPSGGPPLLRDEKIVEDPADLATLTPRYTEEALSFINRNRERPFFLYLPYTYPHVPLDASGAFKGKSPRGLYGDVVEELDASVGRILDTLRTSGLAERTLVFFTSDNGPWLARELNGGSAGLLREGKGTTWEGGMREPGIAWWPGRIRPGSVCREPAATLDLLPTLSALAGLAPPTDRVLDGGNLSPVLFGTGPSPRHAMFFYNGADLFAYRKDRYKIHVFTSTYGNKGTVKQDPPLLYDLEQDPSEKMNIAAQHAEIVADLLRDMAAHQASFTPPPTQLEATIKE